MGALQISHLLQVKLGRKQSGRSVWKDWSSSPQTIQIRALLLIHIWGIWLARNRVIFLKKSSSPEEVATKGLDILYYFPQTKNNPTPRIITPK